MKDYFQDILPPHDAERPAQKQERSIRHISITPRAPRAVPPSAHEAYEDDDIHASHSTASYRAAAAPPMPAATEPAARRSVTVGRLWLWLTAVGALAVAGTLLFFVFRKTTVTIVPRTHAIVFDGLPAFEAYPIGSAATGTLAYETRQFDLEESEPIKADGMRHVEKKASGSVTVFNAYSAAPMKLVAGTRFASPNGLIFRTPSAIVIPGKTGTTPGSVTVTIIADAAGDTYNIAPTKFSLPGLAPSPLFTSIYAVSSSAFTGGFSGDEPAADPDVLSAARAAMHSRIEEKAREMLAAGTSTIAFFDLATLSYTDLPSTTENDGSIRLHERVHITVPVFTANALATAVARQVSASVQGATIHLVPGAGFGAQRDGTGTLSLGTDPFSFMLVGKAQLVWDVDTAAIRRALVGHDAGTFQQIIKSFPSVEQARARIEPFWSTAFPKNPEDITIIITAPGAR